MCKDKRDYINALATEAEIAAQNNDSGKLYKITNQLVNKNPSTQHIIRNRNGDLLQSDSEQITRWREHFCEILNNTFADATNNGPASSSVEENVRTNVRISTQPPSREEIKIAVKSMPNDKAAGIDGITAELYKADVNTTADILYPLIFKVWETGHFPVEWKSGIIVKLPRKGNLSECSNWRGICVLPVIAKIIAKIILERVKNVIEDSLNNEQAGFRAGRSCADHINTLRIIIEQSVEYKSPLYLLFIDFEKAFDKLNRIYIWRSLRRRGVPNKII